MVGGADAAAKAAEAERRRVERADEVDRGAARGDLGVEFPPQEVPMLQKQIVEAANVAGKPVKLIPDLVKRNFEVSKPNRVWVSDITYIRTWEGWLYLAIVMDLFSRKIVGWATRSTIHRDLVLDAVMMSVKERQPQETIIHSDQGSQYGSDDWRRFCLSNGLKPSMSRRGNCWDNAVAESFFGSLKKERIKKRIYRSRDVATADVSDYIESFYNPERRHQHLGGVSPEVFETTMMGA